MKRLNLLIKPASSLCNMRCRYCFYSDIGAARSTRSYGIMETDRADKIIGNIFADIEAGDEITFAFQGGEPTLAGLPWFRHFAETAAARKRDSVLRYSLQTNGLLLDQSWCDFFREYNFLIGLSIDSGRRFHDRNRLMPDGGGSYGACMRSKELLDKNQVEYNIFCVLSSDLANEPDKAWNFIMKENIRYIQFIPCLEPLSDPRLHTMLYTTQDLKQAAGNVLRPALFASFYSRLLQRWIRELENGNYISVKLFDDVVNYFCRGIPTACGIDGQCRNQYLVEADGGVYPCDFYALDQYKIGNLCENTIAELSNSAKVREFIEERPTPPGICESCAFSSACRGGCKRMRNVMYAGTGVCGFRLFLEKCLGPLETTVRRNSLLGNESL